MNNIVEYIVAVGAEEDANVLRWHRESQVFVEMSPDQFLNLTPSLKNISAKSVEHIIYRLINGLSIDIPFLDIDVNLCEIKEHEGRHRAYAAKIVGLKKIPVVIYLRSGSEYVNSNEVNIFKMCKIIKSQKCSFREKRNFEIIDSFVKHKIKGLR